MAGIDGLDMQTILATTCLLAFRFPACDYADCQDAVADVCLHWLTAPPIEGLPVAAALFQASRSRLLDLLRRQRRRAGWTRTRDGWQQRTPSWIQSALTVEPLDPQAQADDRHDLLYYWGLLTLSQRKRIVAIISTENYDEAAVLLGCSAGAIKAGVHKMRARLARMEEN